MKTQIIQLDQHDDILSAKDKIGWSQANRVLLIWPEEGLILSRRIDLALLSRHVRSLGGRLALITRSRQVKVYARELGIPVFRSSEQAQRRPWRSVPRKPVEAAAEKERRERLLALRDRVLVVRPRLPSNRLARLIPFFAGLLSVVALVFFFLPSAAITLDPRQQPQEIILAMRAAPTIFSANPSGSIPAQVITQIVEGQLEANSTGRATLPAATASGSVRLTNLTAQEISVPIRTVVATLDSPALRFETSVEASVPAGPGTFIDVPVRAILAGSSGNVSPGAIAAIEGSLGLSLSADNPLPISAGTDRNSLSPSENDYKQLRETLVDQLQKDALDQMQFALPPQRRLLPASLRQHSVLQETRQPESGQPGERLQLHMQIEYIAWTISDQDVSQVALTVLNAGLPDEYQDVPGSLDLQDASQPILDGEQVAWQMRASRRIYVPLDSKDVARSIAGNSTEQALRSLRLRLALQSEPVIRVAPYWWDRLPFLPLRIQVFAP